MVSGKSWACMRAQYGHSRSSKLMMVTFACGLPRTGRLSVEIISDGSLLMSHLERRASVLPSREMRKFSVCFLLGSVEDVNVIGTASYPAMSLLLRGHTSTRQSCGTFSCERTRISMRRSTFGLRGESCALNRPPKAKGGSQRKIGFDTSKPPFPGGRNLFFDYLIRVAGTMPGQGKRPRKHGPRGAGF